MLNALDDIGDSDDSDDEDDSEDEDEETPQKVLAIGQFGKFKIVDIQCYASLCNLLSLYWCFIVKAVSGQKRPIKSATKTPVAAKKAKSDTPQKTGDLLLSFACLD